MTALGEGPGGFGSPHSLRPNFFWRPPPLSQGLDDRAPSPPSPPSLEDLDPPLGKDFLSPGIKQAARNNEVSVLSRYP